MPPSSHRSGSSQQSSPEDVRHFSSSRGSEPNYIDIDIHGDMATTNNARDSNRSVPQQGRVHQALERPHAWVGAATDLHINLQIEVGDRSFHLHKFPLLSKSEKLNRLVFESRDTEKDRIILSDIPGGADTFELVARFLYGGKFELTPHNVAALRCATDYLEMSDSLGNGNLVAKTESYLNSVVTGSWRDSITVLNTCSELAPWAEDLEIVRRCSESIAWKCSTDPHGTRWSVSAKSGDKEALRAWWFQDVCSLNISKFSKVIHALTVKGLNQALLTAAVGCYAERWLPMTKESDIATKLKTKEESHQASFMAFTGFNQDIVAKEAKKAQHKSYRAIVQGVVNLLPSQQDSMSVKILLKLLRVACAVDAGSFCKTDLAKRIAFHLEKVSLDDLLIPASGESTFDVDVIQQIVEFYLQHQNYASSSPPSSPRSSVSRSSMSGTTTTSSLSLSLRSLSSVSSSDLSTNGGSSVTTESASERSVSGSSTSDSSSVRSSGTGSSITGSSSVLSSRSGSSSFVSTSSETTDSSRSSSRVSSETSSPGLSGDENVKITSEKKFFVNTEGPSRIRSQIPLTASNFKLGQLLEMYLEEVARDSTISLGKFVTLADLFTEFPRDSDDGIYRAIDTFLRAHPTLTELERKKLCRVIDTGALSLAACVHAASNERLPLRVIVQVLFCEQIKLRNAMTGNEVMIDKEVEGARPPKFSSTTSTIESSSDPTTITSSSGVTFSLDRNRVSTSSASSFNPSVSSVASSLLPGGLTMKETLKFVTAEVESLKKAVQELETVKSRLSDMESLQVEIHSLSWRFQEMTHDYTGMTQQVEELTRGSKQKSGWGSGWKKVAKPFQSKDHHDFTTKILTEQHRIDTPPLPRRVLSDHTDVPAHLALRTAKSEIVLPLKTPEAIPAMPFRQESLPNPKPPKADFKPTYEAVVGIPVLSAKNDPVVETLLVKDSSTVSSITEIPTSTPARPEKDMALETSLSKIKDPRKEDNYVITNQPKRRQYRSTSPDYVHSRRHHDDSDSVSVTSTSSYTSTTSTSVSSRSDHSRRGRGSRHRRRRDYSADRRGHRSTSQGGGHRDASLDKHHSRHHHSSVHRSDISAGHRRHGSDEGPPQSSLHSSEHFHRKHRQKEGSEQHSHHSSHSSQNHKEHNSVDSHPRHTSKDQHPSGQHRGQTTSHRSGQRRKDSQKKVPHNYSSQQRRRQRQRHKEAFSDSDGSSDSGTRPKPRY